MKKSFSLLFLLVTIIVIWTACQHEVINANANLNTDSIVIVVPPANGGATGGTTSPAVSDTVCFNSEVLPLYINYCGSAGCHNEASHRDGVITTNYGYIMNGIRAKDPNRSEYYTIIGGEMPPKSSPQMTAANKATILKWINQGALNTSCINTCDTTKFGYVNAVQTIIADNCGGCHGTKPGTANVYLGDYAGAKAYITANKTLFINSINHSASLPAAQRMPPSAKMIDCKILQIQKWIDSGYPQ
ncbi:MAG: hypothetical protein RL387_1387 [Bacteroidota bacterium]|jgi:uncharacterized membrane protein